MIALHVVPMNSRIAKQFKVINADSGRGIEHTGDWVQDKVKESRANITCQRDQEKKSSEN